jgi:hypothetical protein
MHAPLTAPAREAGKPSNTVLSHLSRIHSLPPACLKEIQALVECHERGFMARLGGQCNASRDALNQCLRQEVSTHRAPHAQYSWN